MLAVATMGWLSEMGSRVTDNLKRALSADSKPPTHLGILAFETAKTMSRLVSLYKSLSDNEISILRKEIMKSQGVGYLNSNDQGFLLSLACAERLEDLDTAAAAVARLGHKCSDFGLNRFDLVYTDLKLGLIDLGKLEYGSKEIEKRIEKMERLISATSDFYTSLETLTEMEVSAKKLKQWKKNCDVIQSNKMNFHLFEQKIEQQRKQVRNCREISLWNKTFDKSIGLMARIVCIVYARICVVFGPYIPILPSVSLANIRFLQQKQLQVCSRSGPLGTKSKLTFVRFYSRKSILFLSEAGGYGEDVEITKNNTVFHAAGPSTVGGSGLTLRYANVIVLAERYLESATAIGEYAREDLYQMLPENLRMLVRSKLSKNVKGKDDEVDDESLADGWREALTAIMGWLAPMAHNSLKWQQERNFEKMKFESKPSVLLLQTLHFSDREKTEAAIAEVLVGLSCIYRYENRRSVEL